MLFDPLLDFGENCLNIGLNIISESFNLLRVPSVDLRSKFLLLLEPLLNCFFVDVFVRKLDNSLTQGIFDLFAGGRLTVVAVAVIDNHGRVAFRIRAR